MINPADNLRCMVLRDVQQRHGWSVRDIAHVFNVSPRTAHRWVTGTIEIEGPAFRLLLLYSARPEIASKPMIPLPKRTRRNG